MKTDKRIYIGIDFSKDKFDACIRQDSRIVAQAEIANNKSGFRQFLKWVKSSVADQKSFSYENVIVCGEHTGSCSIALSEYLHAKKIKIWLENALLIKNSSGFSRLKTDKADAERIALYAERFYQEDLTPLFKPEPEDLKKLRALYAFRERLVKERVSLNNAFKSEAFKHSRTANNLLAKHIQADQKAEKEIKAEIENFLLESPELSANFRILTSFKGIGTLTAAVLLIYTSNFSKFDDPRKFACFCGIAPFGKQSGCSVHTKPHVSHYAHIAVKAALTESARNAMRYNPAIREYAARLSAKGKPDYVVLNNVKNKIIHIIFKMIATRQLWDENFGKKDTSGNESPRFLGGTKKGATEAAPSDKSVQRSPSVLGGATKIRKSPKNGKSSKKSCPKICTNT